MILGALIFIVNGLGRGPGWYRTGVILLLSICVGLGALRTYQNNQSVIEAAINPTWKYPREVLELSLKKGLLEDISESSTIVVDRVDALWRLDHGFFYANSSGKHWNVVYSDVYINALELPSGPHYVLRYASSGKQVGEVQVSQIEVELGGSGDRVVKLGTVKTCSVNGEKIEFMEGKSPFTPLTDPSLFASILSWQ